MRSSVAVLGRPFPGTTGMARAYRIGRACALAGVMVYAEVAGVGAYVRRGAGLGFRRLPPAPRSRGAARARVWRAAVYGQGPRVRLVLALDQAHKDAADDLRQAGVLVGRARARAVAAGAAGGAMRHLMTITVWPKVDEHALAKHLHGAVVSALKEVRKAQQPMRLRVMLEERPAPEGAQP